MVSARCHLLKCASLRQARSQCGGAPSPLCSQIDYWWWRGSGSEKTATTLLPYSTTAATLPHDSNRRPPDQHTAAPYCPATLYRPSLDPSSLSTLRPSSLSCCACVSASGLRVSSSLLVGVLCHLVEIVAQRSLWGLWAVLFCVPAGAFYLFWKYFLHWACTGRINCICCY